MKILVAAIAFAVTIGGLFLFENYKTQPKEENYAQIVQGLTNQTQTPIPKLTNKSNKATTKTPTPSPVPSFTPTPITSLPSASSTPLPTLTLAPTFTPTVTPSSTPTPQPTQQNNQITIISLTSPVKQNTTAQLNISTLPNAQCGIKVILPSGSQSTAGGLETKTADNSGAIIWSWKINWNTKPGTATIEINCSKNNQVSSKTLQIEIVER